MNITLQLSDTAYQRLVSTGSRIQGTIGLINPTEGNFSEHRKGQAKPGTRSIKLRHGRASVGDTQVRLTLRIGLDEVDVIPSQVIENESIHHRGHRRNKLILLICVICGEKSIHYEFWNIK